MKEVERRIEEERAELPIGSDDEQQASDAAIVAANLSSLLLKVRGFIAKVCTLFFSPRAILQFACLPQVRRSPQAKRFFRQCCKDRLTLVLELLPYCKTRWSSWYGVISRLLELRLVLSFLLNLAVLLTSHLRLWCTSSTTPTILIRSLRSTRVNPSTAHTASRTQSGVFSNVF
jgi:hypothetical protein